MPPTLRPFQDQLIRDIRDAWASGAQNVMPVAPTGAGKTVILSRLMAECDGPSIAIAHRQELVSQISLALARNGVRHNIIAPRSTIRAIGAIHLAELGQSWFDPNAHAAVGGVDTLLRRSPDDLGGTRVRLQVQDEGHHVLQGNKWGTVASYFPNAKGLYPTATPCRADGRGLGRHADGLMDALVLAPTMRDIIDMGYLTDYRIFAPASDLDVSGVAISSATGDYNSPQLRRAVHKSHIVGDVVRHYLRLARGKLGVTFAVDVESATELAEAYRAAGVPAQVVSANTPDLERAAILRRFARRELLQLVNVDLFGEGFDLPAIECVSFARPTHSLNLYIQQFGRALRLMLDPIAAARHITLSDAGRRSAIAASAKPVAIIIDHVNNVVRHGLPDTLRAWSLDRRERATRERDPDEMPLRVCVQCYQPYVRTRRECPYCGHYPVPQSRSGPEFVDGDLLELDAATLAAMRGEIARVDGDARIPQGVGPEVAGAIRKRHRERQEGQAALREAIGWWAGLEHARGYGESESYRRFYHRYGIDVGSCQILGKREAEELAARIRADLDKFGVNYE